MHKGQFPQKFTPATSAGGFQKLEHSSDNYNDDDDTTCLNEGGIGEMAFGLLTDLIDKLTRPMMTIAIIKDVLTVEKNYDANQIQCPCIVEE